MAGQSPRLGILDGVKIAAFTQFLIGPAGVQYLADLGAEVVKVEPHAGGWERRWSGSQTFMKGWSCCFLSTHRNVRSLTLNLKSAGGQDAARRLAAQSDVLVENFRPGVMERLGLSYEEIRQLNPGIIYASACGYGSDSPFRHLPGQDLLIQAMTGLAAVTGRASEPPTPAGAAIVDQHGASLLAMGILGALYHRERTGQGQRIEVTMVEAALDLQMEPALYWLNGGQVDRPSVPLASGFHPAPYGVYATSDGHMVVSIVPMSAVWEALDRPPRLQRYLDPEDAFAKREAIYRALATLIAEMTTATAVERLRAGGVWCAPVHGYDEVFKDPVVAHLSPVLELEHPQAGTVKVLKHPVRYGAGEPALRRLPPSLGEHNEEVLRELGYAPQEIGAMRESGAL